MSKNNLMSLLGEMGNRRVHVLGDLILDRYIWGDVDRVSPEAPVVVVRVVKENVCLGGAGNVALNLTNLNVPVTLYGTIGTDIHGENFLKLAKQSGIDIDFIAQLNDKESTIKTRVIAQSQHVVRVDRENIESIAENVAERILSSLLSNLKEGEAIIIADYNKGLIPVLFPILMSSGRDFSLSGNIMLVDPKFPNYDLYKGATIVKPNRKEAEEASGIKVSSMSCAKKASELLLNKWRSRILLLTLGSDGMLITFKQDGAIVHELVSTISRTVFDVSGAGDTVASVFTAAIANGASPVDAGQLASVAAGIVIAEVGTFAVTYDALKDAIGLL